MANLRDVADAAGVSVTAASCILNIPNGEARFSEECIQRVRAAARRLNYHANYLSRSLRRGKSEVLGLVIDAPELPTGDLGWYQTKVISGVLHVCREAAYNLTLITNTGETNALQRGIQHIQEQQIDGLIMVHPDLPCRDYEELREADPNLPIVLSGYVHPAVFPNVDLDIKAAIGSLVRFLVEQGHRKVLWLGTRCPAVVDWTQRNEAFSATAWQSGLTGKACLYEPPEKIEDTPDVAYEAAMAELTADSSYTAIACSRHQTAVGVYRALEELGRVVGRDVSVVCDDDMYAHLMSPPLTSVGRMYKEISQRAAELLLKMQNDDLDRKTFRNYRDLVQPPLVELGSSCRAM